MITNLRRYAPDPFITAIVLTVILATFLPARGLFATIVGYVTTAAIVLLFFLHGLRLPRDALIAGLRNWRLHITILSATFVLFPLVGLALSNAFPGLMPRTLWIGVLFLCALPSTVQSSIAFTSIARGNVAGAVAAAGASNMIGIVLTPLIVSFLVRSHGGGISFSGIWDVVLQLCVPFVAGHLMRPWLAGWSVRHKTLTTLTDRGTIVLAVYSAFSAAVLGGIWHQLPPSGFAILILVCAVILAIVLAVTHFGSGFAGFSREDQIAIVFCGSKKSLASGIPMARVLFAGSGLGAIILPLMIFHQMQLMVCAWLARRYAEQRLPGASTSAADQA
jgi:solute carrier family 10 (sodium/bile acid cotransporter), member 7